MSYTPQYDSRADILAHIHQEAQSQRLVVVVVKITNRQVFAAGLQRKIILGQALDQVTLLVAHGNRNNNQTGIRLRRA